MFLNENVPLIRATPRHQWKYNFRRSFVIENVERTTINRDEHLLPIHYRSRKKNHCSSACPSLCPLILPGQSASGLEIETWSYNCPLGKSDIPRALKLSRLNRRVRHNAPSPWPFFFPLFFFFFSFSLFPFFPLLHSFQYSFSSLVPPSLFKLKNVQSYSKGIFIIRIKTELLWINSRN